MEAKVEFSKESSVRQLIKNVLIKGLIIFLGVNLIFAWIQPLPSLGRISAYNRIFPGRKRLPYGENPQSAYNLSLYNLEAMLASHELNGVQKADDEFRIIMIGDSSTWGFLLPVENTTSEFMNLAGLSVPDRRQIQVYNLGYPVMSLTKDLLILSYALQFDPDLIIWPVTLESFPYDKQLFPPLLQNNADAVRSLITTYNLNLDPDATELQERSPREHTIWGERRQLADLIRLQIYGTMWAATGIDQDIPETYTPRREDFEADDSFHNLHPPNLNKNDLAFDVIAAGVQMAGDMPVLIINEAMFISQGENSDIRYNFFYPRWAYDKYRHLLAEISAERGWEFLDAWDLIPAEEFTNSAVHLTPDGAELFAKFIYEAILDLYN